MKKSIQNNFLTDYISRKMYLQNPPMTTDEFIVFCKKLGVHTTKEELEFFEKEKLLFPIARIDRPVGEEKRIKFKKSDGKKYYRPAKDGLQDGETKIELYTVKFYSTYDVFKEDFIGTHYKDLLKNWTEEGNLFDPSTKDFKSWDSFIGEELENQKQKIVSFYSSFQIYWLVILQKSLAMTLNLAGDGVQAISQFIMFDGRRESGSYSFQTINRFTKKLEEIKTIELFKDIFDLEHKKAKLREDYQEFDNFLKFLLSIQSIYYPFVKSSGITIQITGDVRKWEESKHNFNLEDVLLKLNFKIEDIAKWYKIFSDESQKILGIKGGDWIQLWKNIAWSKKKKLEGNIRLGIEYLQWAIMLKRVIEEHLQKEILDIDEMSNITFIDILNIDTKARDKPRIIERHLRNTRYSDSDRNYYHDKYKRLFYLSNDFGLDYQPRVIVFVEGETEETILPIIFENYTGDKPENLGIEFVNFKGVDKLLSTTKAATDLRSLLTDLQHQEKQEILSKSKTTKLNQVITSLENTDIVISNWTSFLSYNLTKWQIIPFFISDNEGGINHFLEAETPINYYNKDYNVPNDWRFLWGTTNSNIPFYGNNFEMANFSDDEIAKVLSEILNKKIESSSIQGKRRANQGIKQVDQYTEKYKVRIAEKLIEDVFTKYKISKNPSVFERPVFNALTKIADIAMLNHPPVDRVIELKNIEYIKKTLQE